MEIFSVVLCSSVALCGPGFRPQRSTEKVQRTTEQVPNSPESYIKVIDILAFYHRLNNSESSECLLLRDSGGLEFVRFVPVIAEAPFLLRCPAIAWAC